MAKYSFEKVKPVGFRKNLLSVLRSEICDYSVYYNGKKVRTLTNWSYNYVRLMVDILNKEQAKGRL